MEDNQLNALINLLADTDEYVSQSARKKILEEFDSIKDKFFGVVKTANDQNLHLKANDIFLEYNFYKAQANLQKWKTSEDIDLLKGLFIINKFLTPELNFVSVFSFFDRIKRNICVDINNLSPIEQVRLMNFLLFQNYNFKVNFDETELNAQTLDKAFSKRATSSFMMTVLYYLFAKKLGIPFYLVRNRNVLLLGYFSAEKALAFKGSSYPKKLNYDFFVNPSDKGFILTIEDIRISVNNEKNKLDKDFLIVTASEVINILIDKILFAAKKQNLYHYEEYFSKFKEIISIS